MHKIVSLLENVTILVPQSSFLAEDTIRHILSFLDAETIAKLRIICSDMKKIIEDSSTTSLHLKTRIGDLPIKDLSTIKVLELLSKKEKEEPIKTKIQELGKPSKNASDFEITCFSIFDKEVPLTISYAGYNKYGIIVIASRDNKIRVYFAPLNGEFKEYFYDDVPLCLSKKQMCSFIWKNEELTVSTASESTHTLNGKPLTQLQL